MLETTDFLNNQAIELTTQGNFTEAIACYKRAITLEKSNYLLWYNLAITYQKKGDLNGARRAMRAAFDLNCTDPEVIEQSAVISLGLKDFSAAIEYCNIGLSQNSSNANLWNTMGVIFFNQNEYSLASEAFERAVSINPYYYDALYNLRDAYSELQNHAGVAACQARLDLIKFSDGQI